MNKAIIIGRLTRDPEMRTTGSGINSTSFTVAVSRNYANQNGERETDFINCVAWRKQAENIAKYCTKGTQVAVEGRIQTRSYDAQDGTKRYSTDVVAEEVEFLSTKGSSNAEEISEPVETGSKSSGKNDVVNKFEPIDDDNLPF